MTLLFIGCVCLFSNAPLITAARAQGEVPSLVPPSPTPATPATPTTPAPSTTPATTPDTITPPATPPTSTATPAAVTPVSTGFPSKSTIHDALSDGHLFEAEQAYLEWVSFWGEDDPALATAIEHAILLRAYNNGNFTALTDMVKAGDREAIKLLRMQVSAGKSDLPPTEIADALRILGRYKDKASFDTLRLSLFNNDNNLVNAAIEALGYMGDKRAIPDLEALFAKADLERSVALVRALTHLGMGAQLQKRYLMQLHFPFPGAREKAALLLAALGNAAGWSVIAGMFPAKDPAYYPLVLTVLSALPSSQSQAWVAEGLAGSEQEQLAALQSLSVFAASQQESVLLRLLHDAKTPQKVRLLVVNYLSGINSMRAYKELHSLAMRFEPCDPKDPGAIIPLDPEQAKRDPGQVKLESQITAQALLGLLQWGQEKNSEYRRYLRIRIDDHAWNQEVVLAVRASMLKYALEASKE